jgi:hypothetical protein
MLSMDQRRHAGKAIYGIEAQADVLLKIKPTNYGHKLRNSA